MSISERKKILGPADTVREIAGNNPMSLADNTSIWLVEAGTVDVFAIETVLGKPASKRKHLFRVDMGDLVFGINGLGDSGSIELIVSGAVGTKLSGYRYGRLKEVSLAGQNFSIIGQLVERWIDSCLSRLGSEKTPSRYENLKKSSGLKLKPGVSATTVDGVMWVKHIKGSSSLFGENSYFLGIADRYFPIASRSWLVASENTEIEVLSTEDIVKQGLLEDSLQYFHSTIYQYYEKCIKKEAKSERERLTAKIEGDKTLFENTLRSFIHVMDIKKAPDVVVGSDDPLFAAVHMVGSAIGIEIKQHATGNSNENPLNSIALASKVQIRQIVLKGDWWKEDNGHMLARLADGDKPVALLQKKPGQYVMINPEDGIEVKVTDEVSEQLSGIAFNFYRSFPNKKLSIFDVITFGRRGLFKDFAIIVLMGIAGGILSLLTPIATGLLFDDIIPSADRPQLLQLALGLIIAAFAGSLFELTRNIAMLRVEGRMDGAIQSAVWDRVINLPVPFFRKYSAGDLASRANGISRIRQELSSKTVSTIISSVFSVFNLLLLFYYSWKLALFGLAIVAILIVFTVLTSLKRVRLERTLATLEGKISGMVLEFFLGASKIRISGSEKKVFTLWANEYKEQQNITFRAEMIENVIAVFQSIYPIVAAGVIFAAFVFYLEGEGLSTGAFLGFNAAFTQLIIAGLNLAFTVVSLVEIIPLYERAKPILHSLPEVSDNKVSPGVLTGAIDVKSLNFKYTADGPDILKDVSLSIKPGEFVALVGSSGSGKSTLLRILLGFERPDSGSAYYDDQELAGLNIKEVRRQIGVVLQNGQLMPGDIFTNIVGSSLLTIDDAWDAARASGFAADIEDMPMKMHTIISEGSGTLSGGQRQRLLIARAIANKPRILLFDEATSALDNLTQSAVSQSLDNLNVTRIVIAHRLSTIINADKIFVMDKGRIVQQGTYGELMKQGGLFASLSRRQIA